MSNSPTDLELANAAAIISQAHTALAQFASQILQDAISASGGRATGEQRKQLDSIIDRMGTLRSEAMDTAENYALEAAERYESAKAAK